MRIHRIFLNPESNQPFHGKTKKIYRISIDAYFQITTRSIHHERMPQTQRV
jgi:hypothetical protein